MTIGVRLVQEGRRLAESLDSIRFERPVEFVYNPLDYARDPYEQYLLRYGNSKKQVLFLGMNPGPWGMAQTGVPFGEIDAVSRWMGIIGVVNRPRREHARRPVDGFSCERSEVSGRRLWGLMRNRYGSADRFFSDQLVVNYCPLLFLEESGRNRTPDKLPKKERDVLTSLCDRHLAAIVKIVRPTWFVGVGAFAASRLREIVDLKSIVKLLHPSPANPKANSGWEEIALHQLVTSGVWSY